MTVNELQSDIVIGEDEITGNLTYLGDYSGYSDDPDEQNGYYLALHIASPGNDNIKVRSNTVNRSTGEEDHADVTLDSDGIVIIRRESILDMSQSIDIMVCDNDDQPILTKTYALNLDDAR